MRTAEYGLRMLSKQLRIKVYDKGKPHPVDLATWNKVLNQIENKIKAIRLKAMSKKRQEQLELYADAGQHCLSMKDIWRNDVSHAQESYNANEAAAALERVKDFMHFLIKTLKKV